MNLEEAREQLAIWDGLQKTAGWKELLAMLEGQMHNRVQGIMFNPLESGDAAFKQEFEKGEFAAFKLISEIPRIQAEAAQAVIDNLKESEGTQDE